MREHFSYSQLNSFKGCKKAYWYRYVENIPWPTTSIEAFSGSVAHETIEWLYRQRISGTSPDRKKTERQFNAFWSRDIKKTDVVVPRQGINQTHYRNEVKRAVIDFHSAIFQPDRSETIMLEEKVSIDIDGNEYIGFVDRIAKSGSKITVIDYKTSRSTQGADDDDWLQLRAYAVAFMATNLIDNVDICYEYIVLGETYRATINQRDSKKVIKELSSCISDISKQEDYPAKTTPLCFWCSYNEQCEEFQSSFWPSRRPRFQG